MFRAITLAILAAAGGSAAPAAAQSANAPVAHNTGTAKSVATAADDAFDGKTAVTEGDLKAANGREDVGKLAAIANQRSTVSNNSVSGTSATGNVQIDGQAFQNLQGMAVISANSGNNVAINSAMNVTINMAPR